MVFDKTGTLTTGELKVNNFAVANGADPAEVRRIVYEMEQYSSHPIAGSILAFLKTLSPSPSPVERGDVVGGNKGPLKVFETPGLGLEATDDADNHYYLGAVRNLPKGVAVPENTDVVLLKNEQYLASLALSDELRLGARPLVH